MYPSDSGGSGVVALFRGLREPLTEFAELIELFRAELGIAVLHVRHRVVEPFVRVLWFGANDTTPHDMLEQLVARFLEGRSYHWCLRVSFLLLGHV